MLSTPRFATPQSSRSKASDSSLRGALRPIPVLLKCAVGAHYHGRGFVNAAITSVLCRCDGARLSPNMGIGARGGGGRGWGWHGEHA
jgi:hypothetical protein